MLSLGQLMSVFVARNNNNTNKQTMILCGVKRGRGVFLRQAYGKLQFLGEGFRSSVQKNIKFVKTDAKV